MNHNTARCSSCNTICVLPHLRARANAAKCEACARMDSSRGPEERLGWAPGTLVTYRGEVREIVKCYADGKAAICKPGGRWLGVEAAISECQLMDPALKNMVGPPRGGFNNILKRVYADGFDWEQRARELTEEKRRERPKCIAYHYSDLRMEYAFMYEDGSKSHASLQETVDAYEPVLERLGGVSPAVELLKRIGEYLRFEAAAT